jgi:superfamily I DNA/RNA helicase
MDEEKAPDPPRCTAHLVFGPPGTGKTYYLTQRVRAVVEQWGPESLVVASFTVTAAQEIASRGLGLPDRAVGTLHSLAFRSIGHTFNVALDPKVLRGWNESVGMQWRITEDHRRTAPQSATEGGASNTEMTTAAGGDELLAALDKARATYTPPEDYPPRLAAFAESWTAWKRDAEAVDYTDMIEMALESAREGQPAPGAPMVIVVDEGQDMTRLEIDLALAWGRLARTLVVALDDDQAIMEWRGADPSRLLNLSEQDGFEVQRHVLDRSRRIPVSVHRVAQRWVSRLSQRQPKDYLPRTTDHQGNELDEPPMGAAFCVGEHLGDPELIHRIEAELDTGRTVMVVASCSYMLDPLIKQLREAGIPFGNRYRPTEARWNPLGGAVNGMSTAERVFRYLVMNAELDDTPHGRLWTGRDVRAWLPLVSAEKAGLRRGVKAQAELLPDGELAEEDVSALFTDRDAYELAVDGDLEWLAGAILPSKVRAVAYPLQVARHRGIAALATPPPVTVGTIHSVKGGASDVVYVSPDLSAAGVAQLSSVNGRDQTVRLFYVAVTRAYEELRLLSASNPANFVRRRDLLPADLEVVQ